MSWQPLAAGRQPRCHASHERRMSITARCVSSSPAPPAASSGGRTLPP